MSVRTSDFFVRQVVSDFRTAAAETEPSWKSQAPTDKQIRYAGLLYDKGRRTANQLIEEASAIGTRGAYTAAIAAHKELSKITRL